MLKIVKIFAITAVSLSLTLIIFNILFMHKFELQNIVSSVSRRKPRILCMVTTQPANHEDKCLAIKETWGKRCDVLLFVSTKSDPTLPAVKVCDVEDYDHLWCKTKEGLRFVYNHFLDEADFFYKVDDDTYVIVENLKYFLSFYDENVPIYFGCKYRLWDNILYMSGGSGYVLSKGALKLFIEKALARDQDSDQCRVKTQTGAEDAEMGRCLMEMGVIPGDSRDSLGRGRFFPFEPHVFVYPRTSPNDYANWWANKSYYYFKQGPQCCSDTTVAFHYIRPETMYVIDFLLYHIKVQK